MKKIELDFLTEKGEQAYYKVDMEGKGQSRKDKAIARLMMADKVVSKKPLSIVINIKLPKLAIASRIDEQIINGLGMFGAERDRDYSMRVI